jgi:fructokinase
MQNVICTISPTRIILGGGVMQKSGLLENVRKKVQAYLNDYVDSPEIKQRIDRYIVAPGLGGRAGVMGAIALAQAAAG